MRRNGEELPHALSHRRVSRAERRAGKLSRSSIWTGSPMPPCAVQHHALWAVRHAAGTDRRSLLQGQAQIDSALRTSSGPSGVERSESLVTEA